MRILLAITLCVTLATVTGCAALQGLASDMAPVAEEAVGDAVGAAAAEAANQGMRAAQGEEADWGLVLGAGVTALVTGLGAGVLGWRKRKRAEPEK